MRLETKLGDKMRERKNFRSNKNSSRVLELCVSGSDRDLCPWIWKSEEKLRKTVGLSEELYWECARARQRYKKTSAFSEAHMADFYPRVECEIELVVMNKK